MTSTAENIIASGILNDPSKMPVDWPTIEDKIYDVFSNIVGIDVVWANQNINQPSYPYMSINRTSETDASPGIDEVIPFYVDANGAVVDPSIAINVMKVYFQPINFTVSASFHVDPDEGFVNPMSDAKFYASKLKRYLNHQTHSDDLYSAGISIERVENIIDSSIVINGSWLYRATLDIIMATGAVSAEIVPTIETVDVSSTELGVSFQVDLSQ